MQRPSGCHFIFLLTPGLGVGTLICLLGVMLKTVSGALVCCRHQASAVLQFGAIVAAGTWLDKFRPGANEGAAGAPFDVALHSAVNVSTEPAASA